MWEDAVDDKTLTQASDTFFPLQVGDDDISTKDEVNVSKHFQPTLVSTPYKTTQKGDDNHQTQKESTAVDNEAEPKPKEPRHKENSTSPMSKPVHNETDKTLAFDATMDYVDDN
jgi:hypothetical protein